MILSKILHLMKLMKLIPLRILVSSHVSKEDRNHAEKITFDKENTAKAISHFLMQIRVLW